MKEKRFWYFIADAYGQRCGVASAIFEVSEVYEPWGNGRGYEHKKTGKLLFDEEIYLIYD